MVKPVYRKIRPRRPTARTRKIPIGSSRSFTITGASATSSAGFVNENPQEIFTAPAALSSSVGSVVPANQQTEAAAVTSSAGVLHYTLSFSILGAQASTSVNAPTRAVQDTVHGAAAQSFARTLNPNPAENLQGAQATAFAQSIALPSNINIVGIAAISAARAPTHQQSISSNASGVIATFGQVVSRPSENIIGVAANSAPGSIAPAQAGSFTTGSAYAYAGGISPEIDVWIQNLNPFSSDFSSDFGSGTGVGTTAIAGNVQTAYGPIIIGMTLQSRAGIVIADPSTRLSVSGVRAFSGTITALSGQFVNLVSIPGLQTYIGNVVANPQEALLKASVYSATGSTVESPRAVIVTDALNARAGLAVSKYDFNLPYGAYVTASAISASFAQEIDALVTTAVVSTAWNLPGLIGAENLVGAGVQSTARSPDRNVSKGSFSVPAVTSNTGSAKPNPQAVTLSSSVTTFAQLFPFQGGRILTGPAVTALSGQFAANVTARIIGLAVNAYVASATGRQVSQMRSASVISRTGQLIGKTNPQTASATALAGAGATKGGVLPIIWSTGVYSRSGAVLANPGENLSAASVNAQSGAMQKGIAFTGLGANATSYAGIPLLRNSPNVYLFGASVRANANAPYPAISRNYSLPSGPSVFATAGLKVPSPVISLAGIAVKSDAFLGIQQRLLQLNGTQVMALAGSVLSVRLFVFASPVEVAFDIDDRQIYFTADDRFVSFQR